MQHCICNIAWLTASCCIFFRNGEKECVCLRQWQDKKRQSASAGNRTRVTSMATMYSTTRPLMRLHASAFCMSAQVTRPGYRPRRFQTRKYSDAGTRTRVAWVKARYPNQLDYIGDAHPRARHTLTYGWIIAHPRKRSWADLNRHRWIQSPEC